MSVENVEVNTYSELEIMASLEGPVQDGTYILFVNLWERLLSVHWSNQRSDHSSTTKATPSCNPVDLSLVKMRACGFTHVIMLHLVNMTTNGPGEFLLGRTLLSPSVNACVRDHDHGAM